jgi:hypothetical protein
MNVLSSDLREALAKVGTSTLTGVLNKRGLRSMTLFDVWPIRPEQPRMVGIDGAAAGDGGVPAGSCADDRFAR